LVVAGLTWLTSSCGSSSLSEQGEELSGGPATIFDTSSSAFSRPFPDLARDDERAFFRGRALFRDDWVTAPSSTMSRDGLGPVFNARSCQACHIDDGRGRPPIAGEATGSLLFRLSIPGAAGDQPPIPEPTYGGQLQPLAILGVAGEGTAVIDAVEIAGSFGDAAPYTLLAPSYSFIDLAHGPMAGDVEVSPRVAPQMIGLGLLECVAAADIEALADPGDADGDGISGQVNRPRDVETGELALGRFGWKSNQPSIRQQTAGAFNGDIGITSALLPDDDCTDAAPDCSGAISGGEPELLDAILDDVTAYSRLLAVPARRDHDRADVLRGKQLFVDHGCAGCHAPVLDCAGLPEIDGGAFAIRPYTDLLLHDMGDDLADGRPDSWRVMVAEKAGLVRFVVSDATGRSWWVYPRELLTPRQEKMMSVQPEMIRQLARHLAARFEAKGHHNVKVCAEAFVALNGRRSRPLIDPAVDLELLAGAVRLDSTSEQTR
jgi:CxxC motif-containing protein (DUF1111 family)